MKAFNHYTLIKQKYYDLMNDIIKESNYLSFRAMESNDFIVCDLELSPLTVQCLNNMWKKYPNKVNISAIDCKCTKIEKLVKKYLNFVRQLDHSEYRQERPLGLVLYLPELSEPRD